MPFVRHFVCSEFSKVLSLQCTPEGRASLFADMCRVNALAMIQHAGSGHIGTSFSSLDIMSWVYLNVLREGSSDIFFSSKGHDAPALYAILMALGLIDDTNIMRLRRLGGLPGHPDIHVPGIATNTGSLGMGISKAKGMVMAEQLQCGDSHIYVMLGDGELQEGQIWESLTSAVLRGMGITAIVDHNKIQSDTWVENTLPLGDIEARFQAFGWDTIRVDGHDFKALGEVLNSKHPQAAQPKAIIADTNKGHGVSFMSYAPEGPDDLYNYHSGSLSEEEYEAAYGELMQRVEAGCLAVGLELPAVTECERKKVKQAQGVGKTDCLVPAYAEALVEVAVANDKVIALDADLKLDCGLISFSKRFPDRYVECGIAEQDMVSMAGGLALRGMTPVCHSFACFLTPRANEQIFNNASEGTQVVYVGFLAGLLPAAPGHSHQSVRDLAVMGCIPNMKMAIPCCDAEVKPILDHLVNEHNGPGYIRMFQLPIELPYSLPEDYELYPGRGAVVHEGKDVVICTYGPSMLTEAWYAAEQFFEKTGLSVKVVSLPWLSDIDTAWLGEIIGEAKGVVTLDDHLLCGGLRDILAPHLLAVRERGAKFQTLSLGLTGLPACGQPNEVLKHHGLDRYSLARNLLKAFI